MERLRVLVVVLAGQSFLESRLNGVENVVLAVGEISQKLCEKKKKVSEGGKTRGFVLRTHSMKAGEPTTRAKTGNSQFDHANLQMMDDVVRYRFHRRRRSDE
jgi:hypothetical protein